MSARRLLVVDDDPNIREMVEMILGDEGYEVSTAGDGATALALLDHLQPDLILLDMKMPTMDGWEFSRHYRRRPGPKAPVIVFTASQDASRRAREVGADGYVAKPFSIDELLRTLEAVSSHA